MTPRTKRRWARRIGWGILALVVFLAVAWFVLLTGLNGLPTEEGLDVWTLRRVVMRIRNVAVLLFLLYVALILIEGPKRCVLYLRRFNLNTDVISPENIGGLGRSIRIVTLDDRQFVPAEVPPLDRWLTRVAPFVLLFILGAAGVFLSRSLYGTLDEMSDVSYIQAGMLFGFCTGMLTMLFVFTLLHRWRVRRHSRIDMRRSTAARVVTIMRNARAARYRPSILMAQATVVAAGEAWRDLIHAMASAADAIVVDVSDVSANVAWEIEEMHQYRDRCVFIYQKPVAGAVDLDTPVNLLRRRFSWDVISRPKVAYEIGNRSALIEFRQQLTRALAEISLPTRMASTPLGLRARWVATGLLYYSAAAVGATVVGFVIGWQSIELFIQAAVH